MTYLKLSLLSFSLAALMLGCGTESDEPPLVPEVVSIEIDDTNETTKIHSLFVDGNQTKLNATVTYSDGSSTSVDSQLDWESNDTSVLTVHNGSLTPVANSGTAAISASFRDKLFTTIDKNITIVPLTEVNITSEDINITYDADGNASLETNTTGSYTLLVNGTFEDNATILAISSNRVWTSSNTTVALIDTLGLLSISVIDQNGSADINVSVYNEINASMELNVTAP